jgi:hypothetical protein
LHICRLYFLAQIFPFRGRNKFLFSKRGNFNFSAQIFLAAFRRKITQPRHQSCNKNFNSKCPCCDCQPLPTPLKKVPLANNFFHFHFIHQPLDHYLIIDAVQRHFLSIKYLNRKTMVLALGLLVKGWGVSWGLVNSYLRF